MLRVPVPLFTSTVPRPCRRFSTRCHAGASAEVALSAQLSSSLTGATEEPPVALNLAAFPRLPCIPISTSVTTSV